MRKKSIIWLLVVLGIVVTTMAWCHVKYPSGTWRYKMTVTVITPEGEKSGSAVRQMSNSTPVLSLPDVGNPADVMGEAVVVDLGERGVLFGLISHQSDQEFYNAYNHLWSKGGSTPEGIKFYASMPIGTKGTINPEIPPGYPKLVTFKDINDPKSVTEAQVWERRDNGLYFLKEDRMEALFGQGVRFKQITLEITNEPVTWGVIEKFLTHEFWSKYKEWGNSLNIVERGKQMKPDLFTFTQGKELRP